jgi:hypothetical protein
VSANESTLLTAQRVADLINDGLGPKAAINRVAIATGVKPLTIAQRYYSLTRTGQVARPQVRSNGDRVASTLADRLDDLAALVLRLADECRELEADAERGRAARAILAVE